MRGFNLPDKITQYVGWLYGLGSIHALKKNLHTGAQAVIHGKQARKKNVYGAFTTSAKIVPEHILLVDDVVTTGATAAEMTKTLKRAGAKHVVIFAVAKG